MDDLVRYKGFTFKTILHDGHRPYKVKCLETGEEKSSAISFEDAMELIVAINHFSKEVLRKNSGDENYVEQIFKDALFGQKLSQINDIVSNKISGEKIEGIIEYKTRDKFDKEQIYFTEKFRVTALCGKGNSRVIVDVIVEEK